MRVLTTDQKRWLIGLHKNNTEFKHSRVAQELKDNFGGDTLYRSTIND